MTSQQFEKLKQSVAADDLARVAELLGQDQDAIGSSDGKNTCAIGQIFAEMRSVAMADLLLEHGATAAMISEWWAPGFGLAAVPSDVGEHLVQRGALLSPHAASALGLVERLRQLLDQRPEWVNAKGGDGCRPLHFSRNIDTALLLLDRGAELDAKDDDHDSTPAQWRIGDAPQVTRLLLQRGAKPDIFMAAALDDIEMAKELIRTDPACPTYRIGTDSGPFPGIGFQQRGGTIYQWTLGFNKSPQEIAFDRGHRGFFDFLFARTPPRQQLLISCMMADRPTATRIAAQFPNLINELDEEDKALLAKSCWETNLNRDAVRLMLDLGFPIDIPEHNHGYLPLHNAAWCGDAELVKLLLERGHPVGRRDPGFQSTALGYALHSYLVAKRHPEGDFPRVVRLLLEAGEPLEERQFPTGDEALDAVIRSFREAHPSPSQRVAEDESPSQD